MGFDFRPDGKGGVGVFVVPDPLRISEGELWSWVRSVMSQGADIRCDYDQGVHKGYEAYSARLDAAAAERAQELFGRLTPPNAELTGAPR